MKAGTCLLDAHSRADYVNKYFVVEGVSKTLDGLEVKVADLALGDVVAEISVLRRQGLLIGDRPWQEAVVPGTLFIPKRCLRLSAVQDEMEFSSKSDFGKHIKSKKTARGKLTLFCTQYENAVVMELTDTSVAPAKRLFSRVFYEKKSQDEALELFRSVHMLTTHVDDIEFELKGIK